MKVRLKEGEIRHIDNNDNIIMCINQDNIPSFLSLYQYVDWTRKGFILLTNGRQTINGVRSMVVKQNK